MTQKRVEIGWKTLTKKQTILGESIVHGLSTFSSSHILFVCGNFLEVIVLHNLSAVRNTLHNTANWYFYFFLYKREVIYFLAFALFTFNLYPAGTESD